jgi:hypothetical protein
MGDDAWLYHMHTELRKFNYFGDTTRYTSTVTEKSDDGALGPRMQITISGTNQRGQENTTATAVILLASRTKGPVRLPNPPAELAERAVQIQREQRRAEA